ncbi:phage terminase small subunit [Acinetobacter gerneri]|uniref:phage terminase small subunit n=1 Tax=Acinetobacter gerneri TaxID=202952 RepID=UPI003A84A8DA
MTNNTMLEHREKMLAIKAQKLAQNQDPRVKAVGFVAPETDPLTKVLDEDMPQNAETNPPSPTHNIELRLFNQLNELKQIKSVQEKIEFKRAHLPQYYGYIEGCLAVSPATQNNTLVTLMIWAIDTGHFDLGIRISEYALLNEMVMPESYSRGIAEFVTEQCAEAFLGDTDLAKSNAMLIEKVIELGVGEAMVDEVRAKIYKAQGLALKDVQPTEALNAFKNALRFNKNAGCKKDVTQLEKLLNAQSTESSPDANVGSQADASTDPHPESADTPASTDTTSAEDAATE